MKNMFLDMKPMPAKAIALIDEDMQLTYHELIQIVETISEKIAARSLVALLVDNSIDSVLIYLACLKAKAVILMIDHDIEKFRLQSLIGAYRPNLICSNKPISGLYNNFWVRNICVQFVRSDHVKMNDSLALLLPTSGSMGSSKYVRISYTNLISNTESIIQALPVNTQDRAITTMPMSYSYGLSIINTHLSLGAAIVMNKTSIIEKNFWTKIHNHKVTNFGGVPYTYEVIDRLNLLPQNDTTLRYLSVAGGKLSKTITERLCNYCCSHNIRFYTMYGQTEATARMFVLPWEYAYDKNGSAGVCIPGGNAYLTNEAGDIITQPYTPGEIVYEGNNVSLGYAENYKDLDKGDQNAGVLKTGDIGVLDHDRFLYIKGRKSRFLKICGKRYSLLEIEKLIQEQDINEVACIQINDFLIVFVTKYGYESKILTLLYKIGISKQYVIVTYIETIPRHSGKVMYSRLENQATNFFGQRL